MEGRGRGLASWVRQQTARKQPPHRLSACKAANVRIELIPAMKGQHVFGAGRPCTLTSQPRIWGLRMGGCTTPSMLPSCQKPSRTSTRGPSPRRGAAKACRYLAITVIRIVKYFWAYDSPARDRLGSFCPSHSSLSSASWQSNTAACFESWSRCISK